MLGTLVGAGVPLVASLRVAREALGNQTLADTVSTRDRRSAARHGAVQEPGRQPACSFPPSVIEMVAVAEETGRLDKELIRARRRRTKASWTASCGCSSRLAEPLMLFLMAGVIGTVVVGMLLPIFSCRTSDEVSFRTKDMRI